MKNYILNLETGRIELHFEKSEYLALTQEQKDELKGAFLWSKFATAWVSKSTKDHYWAKQVAKKLGFEGEERTGERLSFAEEMERKQEKAEHRADRMEMHAENAEKRAQSLQSEFNKYRQDWSWLTQPIISGHSGSQRFGRQRDAVMARYEKGFEEYRKSEYFRGRAEIAQRTADMKQLKNAAYLENRIRECKAAIKKLTANAVQYEELLYKFENGEEIESYGGIYTVEKLPGYLADTMESIEYEMDKQAYFENAMDALRAEGRKIYTKDDIKVGHLVKIRGSWRKVLTAGPKNVNAADQYSPWGITYTYAEIQDMKIPEDWTEKKTEAHNVKEGEIFTHESIGGSYIIKAVQVIGTTDKTVQIKEIKVVDNKPVLNAFKSDATERKTVKRKQDGTTVLTDGDWYMYRYTAEKAKAI